MAALPVALHRMLQVPASPHRLFHAVFSTSTPYWQDVDNFYQSKFDALIGSQKATIELLKRFRAVLHAISDKAMGDEAAQKALSEEMVQICLRGNAMDLSLINSMSVEEFDA